MILKGWIRSLRREAWRLAPDASKVMFFMSQQANFMGASVLGALIYLEKSAVWLYLTLALWLVLSAIGAVIEQPELENGDV